MNVRASSVNLSTILRGNLTGFALVFLFHLGFKLLYINNSGFWYGETFNLFFSEQDWGLIKHTAEWNRNPPLYYYFLYIWRNLFGISEFAIRFSSALFSALAAGFLFLLVSKHFNRLAVFFSILLFTLSSNIYAYSQEANSLSLILFLTMVSVYLFFELLEKRSVIHVILLGICNFLLVYGQYNTVSLPILQLLIVTVLFRKEIFVSVGISFLITALLIIWRLTAKTLHQILYTTHNVKLTAPSFRYLQNVVFNMFNGEMLFWMFFSITCVSFLYLAYSGKITFKDKIKNIKLAGILFLGLGSVFASWGLFFVMPDVSEEYFGFSAPFLFILVGLAVGEAASSIKYAVVGATVLFCIISFTRMHIETVKPLNYKSAVKVVKKLRRYKTLILVETRDVGHLFAYYFDKNAFRNFKEMESMLNAKGVYLVSTVDDVKALDIGKYKWIVLTQTFEKLNPGNSELYEYIDSVFKFHANNRPYVYYADVSISIFGRK